MALAGITADELNGLAGHVVSLGPAVLYVHRRTEPCKALERRLKLPGLEEALWDQAGISCEVAASGTVRPGGTLKLIAHCPERIDTPWTEEMFTRPSLRQKKQG